MKDLIWQNVTEGPMTRELKDADIVFLSEASIARTRAGRPPHKFKLIRSKRLKGLVISVKRSEFVVVDSGYRMFHRSGKAEGWDHIRTPARGVLWIVGYWRDDPKKEMQLYWVTHFLNSWNPMPKGRDRWTDDRFRIVAFRSIPVVKDLVQDKMRNGVKFKVDRVRIAGGAGGGDTNSIPWDGDMGPEMFRVHNKGLDRIWRFGRAKVTFDGDTPKTGVGNQMRHEGKKAQQDIQPRKVA